MLLSCRYVGNGRRRGGGEGWRGGLEGSLRSRRLFGGSGLCPELLRRDRYMMASRRMAFLIQGLPSCRYIHENEVKFTTRL